MDARAVLMTILILVLTSRSLALTIRPCAANKVAPKGLTLVQMGGQGQDDGCMSPTAAPVTEDTKPQPTVEKDEEKQRPVSSTKGTNAEKVHPSIRPRRPRPPPPQGFYDGILPWLPPGIIAKWVQRPLLPSRPPNPPGFAPKWFFGWFTHGEHRPPKPTKPPSDKPSHNDIKPVYEDIDEEGPNEWKPGGLVGVPNNDIVGATQDLSSWSRPPTPKPTRPPIPGYPETSTSRSSSIFETVLDLLIK